MAHNGITSLAGLENNTKLNTLDITGNRVESLEGIAHLTEMNQFWASDNQIKDINHLDSYLGPKLMPKLETVYLEGNPAQQAEGASYRRKVILALPQISQLDATYVACAPRHHADLADSCAHERRLPNFCTVQRSVESGHALRAASLGQQHPVDEAQVVRAVHTTLRHARRAR